MVIYHNPRCTKSREGLALLQEKNKEFDVREYLKECFTRTELQEVLKKLKIQPSELLRRNEKIYKEEYKGKEIREEEWIEIMIQHPQLIERPIIVNGNKAVIGRPKERILEIM